MNIIKSLKSPMVAPMWLYIAWVAIGMFYGTWMQANETSDLSLIGHLIFLAPIALICTASWFALSGETKVKYREINKKVKAEWEAL